LIQDQEQRLLRARGAMVNFTEARLKSVIEPEQYWRLIRDGKDIGYAYVIEEQATGLPHKGMDTPARSGKEQPGIRIGIRSRTWPEPGVQVDGEAWMWVGIDRKQEEWSNLLAVENSNTPLPAAPVGAPPPRRKPDVTRELGIAIFRTKPTADPSIKLTDPKGTRVRDAYHLSVSRGTGRDTIERDLPPFYLPQAMAHLLPRLLPRSEARTYLFATYVSERQEVMRRYVDVLDEQDVKLGAKTLRVIPVKERLGLEGAVTTHYISPEGKFLGSVNEETKVTILITDQETLHRLWQGKIDLTPPNEVVDPTNPTTAPSARQSR